MKNEKSKKLIILVPSWDGAKELWEPFSRCIKKNWSNCPYDMLLLTQSKEDLKNLVFSDILSSATEANNPVERIRRAITVLDYEYVMLLLDDYFAYKSIPTGILEKHICFMREMDIDYLDFDCKGGVPRYEQKGKGENFYISTGVPCIFNKSFLMFILENIKAHSMREFEVFSSQFLNDCFETYRIYTCINSNMFFMHGVLEGYWRWPAVKLMRKNKIKVKYETYKKSTVLNTIKTAMKAFAFNMIRFLYPNLLKRYYSVTSKWTCRNNR